MPQETLISTGALATLTGKNPSTIKYLEARGIIAPGIRVVGSNRRVWPSSQVELIREQLAAHKGSRSIGNDHAS